jgi:phosphatidylinositol phospholipase C delta
MENKIKTSDSVNHDKSKTDNHKIKYLGKEPEILEDSKKTRVITFSDKMEKINKKFVDNSVLNLCRDYLKDKQYTPKDGESVEKFIYGMKIKKVSKTGKCIPATFYLNDKSKTDMNIIHDSKLVTETFSLHKIKDISFGNLRGAFMKIKEKRKSIENFEFHLCLSLHFNKAETLDILFYSFTDLCDFIYGITFTLTDEKLETEANSPEDINIKKIWKMYDKDHNGKMDLEEFTMFIRHLNISSDGEDNTSSMTTEKAIEELFNKIDLDNSGSIDFFEFITFYRQLTSGWEFEKLFQEYSKGKDFLTVYDMIEFLKNEQKEENIKYGDAAKIILDHRKCISSEIKVQGERSLKKRLSVKMEDNIEKELKLNLSEFKQFLVNKKYCNVYNVESFEVEQNMDRPLNEYLIFSSHNTYLTNHQLYGESNVEMYNFAVMNGCRLVELDCWDGPKEPIITHGKTFTTKINFRDVLTNLRENSFKNSPFPVILSIEMHCSAKQQKIMADLFSEILKDIYIIDENNLPECYPSPNELKGKFIIKEDKAIKNDTMTRMSNGSNTIRSTFYNTNSIQFTDTMQAFEDNQRINTCGTERRMFTTVVTSKDEIDEFMDNFEDIGMLIFFIFYNYFF